eukprot:11306956-Ditylum_brightwellii.AAC.1
MGKQHEGEDGKNKNKDRSYINAIKERLIPIASRITVGSYIQDLQIRLQVTYYTQIDKCHKTEDCIKEGCGDVICTAIERVAATMRSKKGEFTKLVLALWYDESDTNPIAYTAPNEMQKVAAKLNWYNARELLNGAFFNHMKKGKNIKQRKTKIRLLYN